MEMLLLERLSSWQNCSRRWLRITRLVKQVFKEIYSEDPLQARAPLLDQFANKWGKLQIQMKIFEESFLDCFDIVQKIADCASAASGEIFSE